MQPEVNNQEKPRLETVVNEVTAMETKPVATEAPKENVAFTNKPKKNHGMLYGMIILAILAIGGIGFGVWAMLDGNAQKEQFNSQISVLRAQNDGLQKQLDETLNESEDVVFWPATPVHSDNKIYMINDSDIVVAVLEVPIVIQSITGCGQTITEKGANNTLSCMGVSNTGQEFGFSYDTNDGTLELTINE